MLNSGNPQQEEYGLDFGGCGSRAGGLIAGAIVCVLVVVLGCLQISGILGEAVSDVSQAWENDRAHERNHRETMQRLDILGATERDADRRAFLATVGILFKSMANDPLVAVICCCTFLLFALLFLNVLGLLPRRRPRQGP